MPFFKFDSPFTARPLQVWTYLLGVALFSISFLVFLNASVSFVITDLIGQSTDVGDAVGTLGFADELVALVACPSWGLLSDRVGVRAVCVLGYTILGISLFVFVQAKNVCPQLLLARILFSLGGAAASTMVTAVLPAMTLRSNVGATSVDQADSHPGPSGCSQPPSAIRQAQCDQARGIVQPSLPRYIRTRQVKSKSSLVAGLVGTFTGCGALLALGIFLPLPARLSKAGQSREQAVTSSFYIVGSIAVVVAVFCFVGLRNLKTEENKGLRNLFGHVRHTTSTTVALERIPSTVSRLQESAILGFTNLSIGLGYLGGFVARASSVGISLFIPLFVNAYFIRTGLCPSGPDGDSTDVKARCRQAYTLAASLTGVSQAVALVLAPLYGWLDGRYGQTLNAPLLFSASSGVVGYLILANLPSPRGNAAVWISMVLIGNSQIGAIVCSLSSLSRGIEGADGVNKSDDKNHSSVAVGVSADEVNIYGDSDESEVEALQRSEGTSYMGTNAPLTGDSNPSGKRDTDDGTESSSLLPHNENENENDDNENAQANQDKHQSQPQDLRHLKGTIAGLYSLCGGAGILLLTKLGGYAFDRLSIGAPFYMLAIFNAILLVATSICTAVTSIAQQRRR